MLNEKIKLLSERCDDLQAQISAMKEERAEEQDAHFERAKQSLLEREHFNFKEDEETADETHEEDNTKVPELNKFEIKKNCSYRHNMK